MRSTNYTLSSEGVEHHPEDWDNVVILSCPHTPATLVPEESDLCSHMGDTILLIPLDTIDPWVEALHSLLQVALDKSVIQITKMQMHNVIIDRQKKCPCLSYSVVHDIEALHMKKIGVQIS